MTAGEVAVLLERGQQLVALELVEVVVGEARLGLVQLGRRRLFAFGALRAGCGRLGRASAAAAAVGSVGSFSVRACCPSAAPALRAARCRGGTISGSRQPFGKMPRTFLYWLTLVIGRPAKLDQLVALACSPRR